MPKEETRRRKKTSLYDILVVPAGEVSPTRSFRTSRLKLLLLGVFGFLVSIAVTLAFLMYTPVAMYVPIPNPALEQRYGKQIVNLQQRLNNLAEDVMILRDYNVQLRKALGENGPRDSLARKSPSVTADEAPPPAERNNPPPNQSVAASGEPSDLDLSPDAMLSPAGVGESEPAGMHPGFPLLMPIEGIPTRGFDPAHGHFGFDIAARKGTPVCAATDGYVAFSGWTYDDGNMLMISHGGGYLTVYKHAQSLLKVAHTTVKRGETIALAGSTGKTSLGPHLHFEVWKDGIPRDPNDFLLSPTRIQ